MKNDNSYEENEISDINMTPFVDIVLVILVIFMATATFVVQGKIHISLPKAHISTDTSKEQNSTIITVDKDGKLYLNDKASFIEEIDEYLSKNSQLENQSVILRSDTKAYFEHIVSVIDICKKNSIEKFAIQTQEIK